MKLMTLGDLRKATADLPDDMPLVGHTSGNSFSFGNAVTVIEVRPHKAQPDYLVGPYKDTFSASNLGEPVKVLSFD